MQSCINKALGEAKEFQKSAGAKSKIPPQLRDDEITDIEIICELLEPLADLTDAFQGDGVTCSMAIIQTIKALKGKKALSFSF